MNNKLRKAILAFRQAVSKGCLYDCFTSLINLFTEEGCGETTTPVIIRKGDFAFVNFGRFMSVVELEEECKRLGFKRLAMPQEVAAFNEANPLFAGSCDNGTFCNNRQAFLVFYKDDYGSCAVRRKTSDDLHIGFVCGESA